jgi:hypothetical protein
LVVVRPVGFDPVLWVRALAAEEPVPGGEQLMYRQRVRCPVSYLPKSPRCAR